MSQSSFAETPIIQTSLYKVILELCEVKPKACLKFTFPKDDRVLFIPKQALPDSGAISASILSQFAEGQNEMFVYSCGDLNYVQVSDLIEHQLTPELPTWRSSILERWQIADLLLNKHWLNAALADFLKDERALAEIPFSRLLHIYQVATTQSLDPSLLQLLVLRIGQFSRFLSNYELELIFPELPPEVQNSLRLELHLVNPIGKDSPLTEVNQNLLLHTFGLKNAIRLRLLPPKFNEVVSDRTRTSYPSRLHSDMYFYGHDVWVEQGRNNHLILRFMVTGGAGRAALVTLDLSAPSADPLLDGNFKAIDLVSSRYQLSYQMQLVNLPLLEEVYWYGAFLQRNRSVFLEGIQRRLSRLSSKVN